MTNILIVEDSATQAERLRGVLEENGYDVIVAYNAESALSKIDSSIDMVISDIVMPGMSGYELCKRIKAGVYGRNLPVMLLSTLGDPMDIISGLECGADNFVTKPYQPQQLLERVNTVLESRRLRASGKLRVGVEVMFLGRNFTINSDKEQILDLLMSTFEDIVRTNRDLQKNRAELAAAKLEIEDYAQGLERRVDARTRELADQKRLLAQAQSMAHVGNWRIAVPSLDCEWSDEMYAIYGVSPEDFAPTIDNVIAAIHPDDRGNADRIVQDAIANKRSYNIEYRILRPDGEERHCWAEGFWEQSAGEGSQHLVGYCQDVTERKMAERIAKESAARYRHIVESMVSGLVVISEGRFLYVNEAACEIFGVANPADIVGKPFVDALVGSRREEIAAAISQPRRKDEPLFREEKLERPDGKIVDVEISKAALTFAGLPATQLIIRDITETKALTQQLHQAQKMEVVGQLTGGIAHDFNNLLTVVISNLDMILSGGSVNTENRELAEAALAASLRGAELTRQLLAFSRKQTLQRQTLDPNELVTRTAAMLKRAIAANIELHADLGAGLWHCDLDPSQLESALTNLVVNARDAMPNGGTITIETKNVTLDEAYAALNQDVPAGEYVMMAVSDTGSGIPPDVLSRVFEPFFTTKEVGRGTGLGLSMVYGFMKQSGGHVKIYSEVGRGTVVRLYLPKSANQPAAAAIAVCEEEIPAAGHERILIVEDDEAVRSAATQQLKELGYVVFEAPDGRTALDILRRENIDLLFTDMTMPGGLSGPDLARTATAKDPALKVLITSGFTETTMRGGEPGEKFELLSKPYRRQELALRVRRVLKGAA
jgi:PAS domain S-box-containing protein